MEYFRLLLDYIAWITNQFLSGIRYSWKAGSLWGMMTCVGGVRKSIDQSWLAKGLRLGLGLLCWGFLVSSVRDSLGRGQHSSNRVSGIFTKTMHQSTAPSLSQTIWPRWASRHFLQLLYSSDLALCDFWLFPKLRGCLSLWDNWGDERGCDEVHWQAHTRGLPWGLPEVFGTVQQVHCSRRRLDRRGLNFMCVLSIKVPLQKKKFGNLFNDPRTLGKAWISKSLSKWYMNSNR